MEPQVSLSEINRQKHKEWSSVSSLTRGPDTAMYCKEAMAQVT